MTHGQHGLFFLTFCDVHFFRNVILTVPFDHVVHNTGHRARLGLSVPLPLAERYGGALAFGVFVGQNELDWLAQCTPNFCDRWSQTGHVRRMNTAIVVRTAWRRYRLRDGQTIYNGGSTRRALGTALAGPFEFRVGNGGGSLRLRYAVSVRMRNTNKMAVRREHWILTAPRRSSRLSLGRVHENEQCAPNGKQAADNNNGNDGDSFITTTDCDGVIFSNRTDHTIYNLHTPYGPQNRGTDFRLYTLRPCAKFYTVRKPVFALALSNTAPP